MAKNMGDLIVRLSLDSTAFEGATSRFEAQMAKLQKQFKSTTTGVTDFDKVTEKLKVSAETLTQKLDAHKTKLAALNQQYKESVEATGADSEATKKLAADMDKLQAKIDQTEKGLNAVNAEIKKNENGWYRAGTNLVGAGEKVEKFGKSMTDVGKKVTTSVTVPIVALGTAAVNSAMTFESAFAGVRKTVDATEEEFGRLSDAIRQMALEIPIPANELAGIMEIAGQLGVRGEANLLKFTQTIAHLGVTTNLTQEAAATMLAQFANITGMPLENIDKLASTVVALGNNFETTEADIVSMGQRLAGAGAQVGMTDAQIMGLSAALTSVGIQAEMGGSAFSKLMVSMQLAAENGLEANNVIKSTGMSLRELELFADADGKAFKDLAQSMGMTSQELKGFMANSSHLQDFAEVAGMSGREFEKAFKEDAAGAITAFIQGLASMDDQGVSAIKVLDEMGITEVRLRDALLRTTGAVDGFVRAQDMATASWEENSALTKEAEERYRTFESQLQLLKNALNELGIQFGEVIIPMLLQFIEKIRGAIEWVSNLSEGQKQAIVNFAAFAAAVGPVILVLGQRVVHHMQQSAAHCECIVVSKQSLHRRAHHNEANLRNGGAGQRPLQVV